MRKDQTINIGIGFATGRKNFLRVLKTYIFTWKETGLTDRTDIKLSLFIAYDLSYSNANKADFTQISAELKEQVGQIYFIDDAYVNKEIRELTDNAVIDEAESVQFFSSGYAAMRNAILYAAVKRKMDFLLFLDDDEYPLAVTHAHNVALWSGQHLLETHLKHIWDADITNGYHCGYISPIPYIRFNSIMTEADFRMFIEAISNDIVNWENTARVMRQGGVTFADTDVFIQDKALDVPEINHCKFISGSNLCLNLTDVSRTLPFYNPPGARGEDTFLSACLHDRNVLRVPCYAFHNGFSTYNCLLSGVLPTELKPVTANTRQVVTRFLNACVGWVRYKPLLLYITQREQYAEKIGEMKANLETSLPKVCAYFKIREFSKVEEELLRYDANVQEHYAQFVRNRHIWDKIVTWLQNAK